MIEAHHGTHKRYVHHPAGADDDHRGQQADDPQGGQQRAFSEEACVKQQHTKDGEQDQGAHLSSGMGMR